MNYDLFLKTAVDLALQAGEIIRNSFGEDFHSGFKSCPSDLVTEVDRQSEELITLGLQKAFPEHVIIGEENEKAPETGRDSFTWYVDPLDGTTNFVYGIPFCSVSIALCRQDRVLAGVVYDPFRRECFTALADCGAFLNGRPVQVDKLRQTLPESLLVTGYPANKSFSERLNRIDYHRIIHRCSNLRALGSAALELAYVACGRLTGFWENTLMPWDVAAGSLLVEEAGGRVTDVDGKKLVLEPYLSIAASNGLIHDELLKYI